MGKKKKDKLKRDIQVGDSFRLFKNGSRCKVIAIENGKVKFQSESGMSGAFPIAKQKEHI